MTEEFTTTTSVLLERKDEAIKLLQKLVKKAKKYGNDDIVYTVSDVYVVEERNPYYQEPDYFSLCESKTVPTIQVEKVDITVTGSAPTVGDYTFLARLSFEDDTVYIDSVPNVELDPKYREADSTCEHCNTTRKRKDVFVVADSEGNTVKVGRTCLRDYLGTDDPKSVINKFAFFKSFSSFGEEVGGWGFLETRYDLLNLLAITASVVEAHGWVSAGLAAMDESKTRTSYTVQDALYPNKYNREWADEIRANANVETAKNIIKWVEDEVGSNDYIYNLKEAYKLDNVSSKRMPLAISAIAGYLKSIEIKKEAELTTESNFVGEVKERLKDVEAKVIFRKVTGPGYAYNSPDVVLYKFLVGDDVLSWFSTNGQALDVDDVVVFDGTVKAHDEYQGKKQTMLTRVKVK